MCVRACLCVYMPACACVCVHVCVRVFVLYVCVCTCVRVDEAGLGVALVEKKHTIDKEESADVLVQYQP